MGINSCFKLIGNLNGSANDVTENGSWYCVYNDGIPIPEVRFIGILVQFTGGTLRLQFFVRILNGYFGEYIIPHGRIGKNCNTK